MPETTGVCVVCEKPSKFRCSACHSVSYCGLEHQKEDWRQHKKVCRPYVVQSSPSGRYVVATRNIKKGGVIVEEKPIVIGPPYTQPGDICVSCLREGDDNVGCRRCGWPVCGARCPGLKNIARHGAECELLTKLKLGVPGQFTEIILPLRCLLLQKTDPKNWGVLQKMALLAAGVIPSRASQKSRNLFEKNILQPLAAFAPEYLPYCSAETVKQVFNALDAYGVRISCPEFGPVVAIFPVTSFMEHSCLPNTLRLMDVPASDPHRNTRRGDPLLCRVVVRADKAISTGENLSTFILDCVMCTYERQVDLRRRRNVHCKCARCSHPRELGTDFGTLKCTKAPCTGWVLPVSTPEVDKSDWKCETCGKIYSADDVQKLMSTLQKVMDDCEPEQGQIQNAEKYEAALAHLQSFVHPNHHFCFNMKDNLQAIYGHPVMDGTGRSALIPTAQLERSAELASDVLNLLMNHAIVSQYERLSETSMLLAFANGEIAKRKLASKQWTLAEANAIREEGRELCARAIRMRYDWLNESPEEQRSTQQLSDMFSFENWQMMAGMF